MRLLDAWDAPLMIDLDYRLKTKSHPSLRQHAMYMAHT